MIDRLNALGAAWKALLQMLFQPPAGDAGDTPVS